jgi:hypothetical protein
MASGHPLFCCVSVGGELFGALARRHFAPPHPIGNQNPAFLVTELSANPIGNQKHPFLVTDEEICRDLFLKIKVFGNKFVYWGHAAISAVD